MADNIFQHKHIPSVVTESSPTTSPIAAASSHAIPPPAFSYVIPYILFVGFTMGVIVTTRMFRLYQVCCCKNRRLRNEDSPGDNNTENATMTQRHSSHETISVVALDIKDRVRLYQRAFHRNKHYHTLTPTDFLPSHNNKNNEIDCGLYDRDIESSDETLRNLEHKNEADEYDEDPSWLYLSLTSSKLPTDHAKLYSPHKGEYDTWDTAATSFDTSETAATTFDTSETDSKTTTVPTADYVPPTKIPGTCIICLEEFCVGETVVWSDDPTTCKHIYHEDCIVRFLATHSHRTNHGSAAVAGNQENPCPTCRQKFCTVSRQDLLMTVLLKSVEVALDERELMEQHSGERSLGDVTTTRSERSERIVAASFALASPIWERTSDSIFSIVQIPPSESFDDRPMDN
jgi:hypothetical protein